MLDRCTKSSHKLIRRKNHPNVSVKIQSEKQKPCQVIQTGKIKPSGYMNVGGSKDNWVLDS